MRALVVGFALLSAAHAQEAVPDTTAPARYLPLEAGNRWVYVQEGAAAAETLVGDSVVAGETYAVVERRVIGSRDGDASGTTRYLVRYDPATARAVYLGDVAPPDPGCTLDADFPARPSWSRATSCGGEPATVSGGYDQPIEPGFFVGGDPEAGTLKAFRRASGAHVAYVAGVGRVQAGADRQPIERLQYAFVGGEPFGPVPLADPTDPAQYFPLAVGNEWEMRRFYAPGPSSRTRRVIERDTVIDGVRWAVQRSFHAQEPVADRGEGSVQLLRYDPATTRVMVRQPDGSASALTCPLGAAFREVVACDGEAVVVRGDVASVTINGVPVEAVKAFGTLAFAADAGSPGGYGAGVGPLPQTDFGPCPPGFCSETFTYVRLVAEDGAVREVGARYGVASDAAPEAARLGLALGPNPTAGPLAVALDVPAPGVVTVEAFDALGRRVWHHRATLGAGLQRVEADAGAWAPGLYVARATAGAATASATLVRR